MHLLQILLSASTAIIGVTAVVVDRAAVVTPAPIPRNHGALERHQMVRERNENLSERQSENDDFCFGGDPGQTSPCDPSIELNTLCNQFEDDPNQATYYQCLCGNGAVAASQACDWCQAAFNISYITDIDGMYTSLCSVYSATIAPIPATYLEQISSYNASYTGTMPGATNTGTGSASKGTQTSSRKASSISSLISTSTQTFVGGGGAFPTSTISDIATQSSPTPTVSTKTGGTQGWRTGDAVFFSAVWTVGVITLGLI